MRQLFHAEEVPVSCLLASFPGFKRGDKTSAITTRHHPRLQRDSATTGIAQLPLSLAREHVAVGSQPPRPVPAASLLVAG